MMNYMSSMKDKISYEDISNKVSKEPIVYVIQEIPGTQSGNPKLILWVRLIMVNLNFYYRNFLK